MPKTAKRRKAKQVQESCLALLRDCLPYFVEGESVTYDHVSSLYQGSDRNAFFRDCKRIKKKLDELGRWLELIGVPLPTVTYEDGRLQIPVRGFVARIHSDLRNKKAQLAEALLACEYKGDPLVPRTGNIYFGFGTTVLAAAKGMCRRSREFSRVSISTSNVEILVHYCIVAPAALRKVHFFLPGGEINWDDGCVIPRREDIEISASIVSFEGVDRQGRFLADAHQKRNVVQQALKETRRTINLVGDESKFGKPVPEGTWPISLPVNSNCRVYLFTNGSIPQRDRENLKAAGVELIQSEDRPSSPSSKSSAPKPR